MRYYTSDGHFWHHNILHFCNRPFKDADEMNGEMVKRWNEVVTMEDDVYYLGDFSLAFRPVEVFPKLLNYKSLTLVAGNHDWVHPSHKKSKKDPQKWIDAYLNNGFTSVQLETALEIDGKKVLLSHMPYKNKEPGEHGQKHSQWRLEDNGLFLLHGHVHGRWIKKGNMIDVGVDAHNFYPISETKVIELMNTPGDIETNIYSKN